MDATEDERPEGSAPDPVDESASARARTTRWLQATARRWLGLCRSSVHRPYRPSVTAAARMVGLAVPRWVLRLGLPLLFVGAMVHSLPFHTTVQGVPLQVQATVFHRPGLSADTTIGNWVFPAVDGLPVGVHVSPENVDVLQLSTAASADPTAFAQRLQTDLRHKLPAIIAWLLIETLIGVGLGLAASAAINMAVRYQRGVPRRADEIAHRVRQLGAATAAVLVVAGYGAASYKRNWLHRSRLTGTLAAAQLFPNQLSTYYNQHSKAYDVLGSVTGIQAALQNQIDNNKLPGTALRIMFISDIHLAAVYPLISQYAANYQVNLIVNTGDETEFGTAAEMTPAFTSAIAAVTKNTPMLWLAGNHDSPAVQTVMASIPGVTVLGSKQKATDGYSVTAGVVQAFGLTIAGAPDPRVYGGPGKYGSDDDKITNPLQRKWMDSAVASIAKTDQQVDIFATHEPPAAADLRDALPDRIRQTNSGHTHAQNAAGDIQHGQSIDLVEGSTGAGGLDNIVRGAARPPIEFSIESVAVNCEFTRVIRFQIRTPETPTSDQPAAYGDDVTASTVYFTPQKLGADRTCSPSLGVSPAQAE